MKTTTTIKTIMNIMNFLFASSVCVNDVVSVNVSDMLIGLKMNTPTEVIDAYIEASGKCINNVETRKIVTMNTGNNVCEEHSSCEWCGTIAETENNCKSCCDVCRCVGCSWNRGTGTNWYGQERVCDSCCVEPEEEDICESYMMECYGCKLSNEGTNSCKECCGHCRCKGCNINNQRYGWLEALYGDYVCDDCCNDRRRIEEQPQEDIQIYYNLKTCIASQLHYDYQDILENYNNQLHNCYQNKSQFLNTWATLTSNQGIDLSLMIRDETGDLSTILFGHTGMEIENARVESSYESSNSHKATSHMIFYGAIGFLIVSISAIISTAIVIKIFNKRKEKNARILSDSKSNIV